VYCLCFYLYLQAEVLQMEPPELYVRQNPNPNAYTLAITGRKPFIVVHTSLLELLSPPELQAVLAHGEQ
jgi:Zn-dependent protease with chaperone function